MATIEGIQGSNTETTPTLTSSGSFTGTGATDDILLNNYGGSSFSNFYQSASSLNWDFLLMPSNEVRAYTLPLLSDPNAIEFVEREGARNDAFNSVSKIVAPGDYLSELSAIRSYGTEGDDYTVAPTVASGINSLFGFVGSDQLVGGDSPNFFVGGAGENTLRGGEAQDFYRAIASDQGYDTIEDVARVSPEIAFDNLIVYAPTTGDFNWYGFTWNFERVGDDLYGTFSFNDGESIYRMKSVDQFAGDGAGLEFVRIIATNSTTTLTGHAFDATVSGPLSVTDVGTAAADTFNPDSLEGIATKNFYRPFGNSGNDVLNRSANVDLQHEFYGGDGLDTIVYGADLGAVRLQYAEADPRYEGTRWNLTPEGTADRDFIWGVERAIVGNTHYALDLDGIGGEAYRIYKAAFDRVPDAGGLGYWIAQMDDSMDMVEVAARFIDSDEFRALYGSNPTNGEFLTKVYNNVLDRDPDAGGYDWWMDQLENNPDKTWEKVLADFSESPENQANVAELIANGIQYEPWLG